MYYNENKMKTGLVSLAEDRPRFLVPTDNIDSRDNIHDCLNMTAYYVDMQPKQYAYNRLCL